MFYLYCNWKYVGKNYELGTNLSYIQFSIAHNLWAINQMRNISLTWIKYFAHLRKGKRGNEVIDSMFPK